MTNASDPTSSGFQLTSGHSLMLSGNEVETLALKAARGAGMDWGLAEEAGYAARWLYDRGLDGLSPLIELCDAAQSVGWRAMRPGGLDDLHPNGCDILCPIATGAALADAVGLPEGSVGAVIQPVLLLPSLAFLASSLGKSIVMSIDQAKALVTCDGSLTLGELPKRAAPSLSIAEEGPTVPHHRASHGFPAGTLERLNDYALATTVPVSDASRADAGSSLDDND